MSLHKHTAENVGSNPRDLSHPRPHFLKTIHRDWRFWAVVILMIALVFVYVMTDNLSLRPGRHSVQPMPEANLP